MDEREELINRIKSCGAFEETLCEDHLCGGTDIDWEKLTTFITEDRKRVVEPYIKALKEIHDCLLHPRDYFIAKGIKNEMPKVMQAINKCNETLAAIDTDK